RPSVRADGMAAFGDLLEDLRIIGGVLADREERRLHTLVGQRLEHRRGGRPRAIVEGQNHLVVAQEVVLLEVLEAEAGTAGGVDLDRAGDAQRVGIGAFRGSDRGGGRSGSRDRGSGRRQRRTGRRGGSGGRGALRVRRPQGRPDDQKRRRQRQYARNRTTHTTLRRQN